MLSPQLMAIEDNVVAESETRVFTILEKGGVMKSVKSVETTIYAANRADDFADVYAVYNDDISIDKASAPNAKPYYRSIERGQIFYDGSRICFMRVPLKKDKRVKVVFERTFKAPEQFCTLYLMSPYYRRNSVTIIKVPSALAGRIKVRPYRLNRHMTFSEEKHPDGSIDYKVTGNELDGIKDEPGAPEPAIAAPQLFIEGYFSDIGELYSHLNSFIDKDEKYSDGIKALAKALKSKAASEIALIDSTAAWVRHNIRYLAIEHNEYAVRPAAASDVFANRAGDCKGSANLIKAILRCNDIDGRLAWIGTKGHVPTDWQEFPTLASGNHMIAAAMTSDSIIYLDGTSEHSTAGYLPTQIRGRSVLIENGDSPLLARVPDEGNKADTDSLSAVFKIDGNSLEGKIERYSGGVMRMSILGILGNMAPKKHNVFIDRFLKYPKKNVSVENIEFTSTPDSPCVLIQANVREANSAQRIGDKILLGLKPLRCLWLENVPVKERRNDYSISDTGRSTFNYTVELPEGYRPEELPEPLHISDRWLRGGVEYNYNDGILRCRAYAEPIETYVPLEAIEDRNASVRKLQRASDTQIFIIPE